MTLKYTLTGKQLYDFRVRYAKHLSAKIVPKWLRWLLSYGSMGLLGLLCILFTATVERGLLLGWLLFVLVLVTNQLSQTLTAWAYARFYEKLPGALEWEHRVVGGRLVTINREVEISLLIGPTATLTKDDGFLYIDVNDRGRVRILLSAFSSPAQLAEFEGLFAKTASSPAPAPLAVQGG